jgi:hypothetical protein
MTDDRDDRQPPASPFPPLGDPPSDWMETADAHDLPTRDNALVALGRFAFPPEPPLDEEGASARDRRWTGWVLLTTTLFLLTFNAASPLEWSRQQPPGWVPETVRRLSEVWVEQLSAFGAEQPRQGLRDAWLAARNVRFVGQAAADGSTPPAES